MKHAMILALATITGASPHARDDPAAKLEGTWEGVLTPSPVIEIRMVFRVEKAEGGGLKCRAEAPDYKPSLPADLDTVTLADGVAVLGSKAREREFRGKLDPDGRAISGEWRQGGKATPMTLRKLDGPAAPSEVWEGPIELPGGIGLKVVFHLGKDRDGKPRGTMDSPDQGAFGLKVDSVARDPESLGLTVKGIGGEFAGKFDGAGASVAGEWKQGGGALALTLKKVDRASEARRTQTPKPPFPYATEEVSYDSRAAGVRISGTLTLPSGAGPFPAVLLISGSGPQDRDESLLGHKPFLVLADDLTRRGVAVLRVDDRGVGKTTGTFATATTFDFADDAEAGFAYLRGRKEIKADRVGLVGHSEGGLIAPIVAARTPEVAFLVLLAGPGLPGGEILVAQQALILKATGAPEAKVARASAELAGLVEVIKASPDARAAEASLKALRAEAVAALPEADRKALAEGDPAGAAVARLATPWMRAFLLHDPRPTLAKVRCPVLAINGELDLQVPCDDNLKAIAAALASGGNPGLTARPMPGLNHLFQTSKTGAPSEYAQIEETFAPAALKVVGDWIVAH